MRFTSLTIDEADKLVFGTAPKPVRITPSIIVGAGAAYPELNYMLPYNTRVCEETLGDIVNLYRIMARQALERAERLGCGRLIIEIELVFELTLNPEWGARVIEVTREQIDAFEGRGVHAGLRATVADIRDRNRPPRNRNSRETELMFESFERCAAYADILSIESTGGKEISDNAILYCDIAGALFGVGELGSRDMEFIWTRIVEIARGKGIVAGGDTACGFANTAMQLAGKRMIPTVFAAVMRAVGAARSLAAVECGATGPSKDCAYEGPMLKAIAGIPLSMEGKSAACAHSSPIGNAAMCCADLWSNESVPYAQLFGGYTPEVCLEELWYDCKLLNTALASGQATALRDMLAESDAHTSAEALVLAPQPVIRIAQAIVSRTDYGERALAAAQEAVLIIRDALDTDALKIPPGERMWLDMIQTGLDEYAGLGSRRLEHFASLYAGTFLPAEYGLI